MIDLKRYRKFLIAAGVVLVALGHALVDGSISPQEWGEIAVAAAGAVGVYTIPNASPTK